MLYIFLYNSSLVKALPSLSLTSLPTIRLPSILWVTSVSTITFSLRLISLVKSHFPACGTTPFHPLVHLALDDNSLVKAHFSSKDITLLLRLIFLVKSHLRYNSLIRSHLPPYGTIFFLPIVYFAPYLRDDRKISTLCASQKYYGLSKWRPEAIQT